MSQWLTQRLTYFVSRIHDENTSDLLMTFLPYHSIPAFATLLSVLPAKVTPQFRFLDPYIRSLTPPPRSVFVHQAVHHPEFLTAFSEYTLKSCRMHCQYTALISFWGGIMTESISGILERGKSGRAAIQDENNQAFLHTFGSIFSESLSMRKVPSLQIASYMAVSVIVSVGNFEDVAITAFMEQIVHAWTTDTLKPGLICLAIMAQQRSAKQLSAKITKSLTKVPDIGSLLIEIGQERRVDKLANGLCLALVERLSKKSDSRGLPTVLDILSSQILKERQVAVIFKSLLLAALQIEETSDEDGSLRRKLGSTLMDLSQVSGKAGDTIQSVIQDMKFDIEELEIKLDLSFRARQMPETAGNVWKTDASPARPTPDLDAMIDNLSSQVGELSPCLIPQSNALFDELSHLFLTIVSDRDGEKALLAKFTAIPKLGSIAAFKDGTYFSFFIQLMCGPYPALARAAAIDMVKDRLKADVAEKPDAQSLLPYCIVALGDPSQRVRRAASDLVAVLDSIFLPSGPPRSKATEALGSLYRDSKAAVLPPEVCARVLHLQILPAVEECILDPNHICEVLRLAMETGKYQIPPEPQVDKKDHLSQSGRLALMTFLSSHVILTPLTIAKERLLKTLNEVRGVQNTTRTQLLLPALQWWVGLNASQVSDLCTLAQIETVTLDARFVDVIVPNDKAGVNYLLEVVSLPETDARSTLVQAIFARLKRMWPSMSDDMKSVVAEHLLRVSQQQTDGASPALASQEGADFLRTVPLTTGILAFFLDSILTGTKMITEPPPNKRRRVSSTDGNRGLVTQVAPELSHALRRVTFVLQLLENSEPSSHPELLNGLFTTLSELQHFRTVVGSELGYLQNLVLRSLLAMMPTYKANKNLSIDNSGGYGDLLVNCIQKSSSPVVQNAALLLIASLATTAPDLVLHSVMPIFTFMGTSVLRQSDDYSAHVVSQTIKEVIPPLIESLRHGRKNPVTGASEILVSFTTAYEHIPAYRRQPLFVALVETLGAREFLFALVGMLVDRYGTSDALLRFILDLLNHFSIEVQLTTLVKLLELVADLYQTKPGISRTLLGIGDEDDQKNVDQIALRQLSALPTFISSRKLKARFGELVDRNDMHASEARELYAAMLEHILGLAHTVKHNKALHSRCGVSLSNLLDLLSIAEFIRSVENLLDNSDMGLRQKVLRALEVRVESESQSDAVSRNALLAFLPQLTSTIRESNDMRYKHTAVTCVDKIAEKYGKKDIEAVVAAASVIAGEHCLGQNEKQLRVMGLLCLTSLVDVLEDAIIPVLPTALPQAVAYLQDSLRSGHVDEQLHNACYSFMTSLAEHLPYMLSPYVDRILEVSNASAVAGLDGETNEGRASCLQFLADRMDGRTMFASLSRNWDSALSAGLLVSFIIHRLIGRLCRRLHRLGRVTARRPPGSFDRQAFQVYHEQKCGACLRSVDEGT